MIWSIKQVSTGNYHKMQHKSVWYFCSVYAYIMIWRSDVTLFLELLISKADNLEINVRFFAGHNI